MSACDKLSVSCKLKQCDESSIIVAWWELASGTGSTASFNCKHSKGHSLIRIDGKSNIHRTKYKSVKDTNLFRNTEIIFTTTEQHWSALLSFNRCQQEAIIHRRNNTAQYPTIIKPRPITNNSHYKFLRYLICTNRIELIESIEVE